MAVCNGAGSEGDHCCYIDGHICEFLDLQNGPEPPRCSVWHIFDRDDPDEVTRLAWKRAPIGRFFARRYPGFNCRDWPQKIPPELLEGAGLCCWSEVLTA